MVFACLTCWLSLSLESACFFDSLGLVSSAHHSCTIHSLFSIARGSGSWEELSKYDVPQTVIDRFSGVDWLIIDEFSFIGCAWFQYLNLTLKKIKGSTYPLSSMHIIIVGDAMQLMPIADKPIISLVSQCEDNPFAKSGCEVFKSQFQKAFYLVGNQRVCQDDLDFQRVLQELRSKNVSAYGLSLMQSRLMKNLDDAELATFSDAIALFQLNEEVHRYNEFKLKSLGTPLLRIKPIITPSSAAGRLSKREADDLVVAKGCKLMLLQNINTTIGLSSGSFCEFVCPFYSKPDQKLENPDALLVRFEKEIRSPAIVDNIVPIFRTTETYYDPVSGSKIQIKHFKLRLCFSISHHKSMGSGYPKILLSLGKEERFANDSYTMFSRVSRLSRLQLHRRLC